MPIFPNKHIYANLDTKPMKQRYNLFAMTEMLGILKGGGEIFGVDPIWGENQIYFDTGYVPIIMMRRLQTSPKFCRISPTHSHITTPYPWYNTIYVLPPVFLFQVWVRNSVYNFGTYVLPLEGIWITRRGRDESYFQFKPISSNSVEDNGEVKNHN